MGILSNRPQPPPKKPEPEKDPEQEEAQKRLDNRQLEEVERVAAWRLLKMMDAGYPYEIAAKLAPRNDIDSTFACRLLAEGWTPRDAQRILL